MKTKLTLVLTLMLSVTSIAQQGINYKALIKDGSGNVVASQSITVQFIIYEGAALTNNVYQETHIPNTDTNGIVIINIGQGTTSDVFSDIDWGSDEHHLNVQIDTGGGLTDMGTTQFMAVPYALSVANSASKIDDLSDGKSDSDGSDDGSSLFLGLDAGVNDDGTNNYNVGIGYKALFSNTIGEGNTAIGRITLYSNTEGNYNTANGYTALFYNTNGSFNTANGEGTLAFNTEGNHNTANGNEALYVNTTGSDNTANGSTALFYNSTGQSNTANGYRSLFYNSIGSNNTAHGYQAGFNSLGDLNVFVGSKSGFNETGSNKLYIENSNANTDNALIYGEFGTDNTTIGNILRTNSEFQIGNPSTTGYAFPTVDGTTNQVLQTDGAGSLSWNASVQNINDLTDGKSDAIGSSVFLGIDAGLNDDGTDNVNVGIGFNALFSNTTGFGNTATGYQALNFNTEGFYNIAIGPLALFYNSTGYENTAIGLSALLSNDTGYENTANGYNALFSNTGFRNTANGHSALSANTTGNLNTASGWRALYLNTTGNNNTAIGNAALINNTTGSNNTAIGFNAQVPNGTGSHQVRMGNTTISSATIQVNWSATSDKRWKEQIRELPYGLEVLKQLKPVDYVRKNNEHKTREMGFIAQDVEALLNKIGYNDQGFLTKDDKGLMSLRYNDFIALLTKAIQEQQVIIEELTNEKETHNNNYEKLLKRVEQLELVINQ